MTPEQWVDAVFDILVEECGAPSIMWGQFKLQWPECVEYRFQGLLGFGGKVWAGRPPRVSCYPEDRTSKRDDMISVANKRLTTLWEQSA